MQGTKSDMGHHLCVKRTALKTRMTFPEFKELIAKIRRRIEFSDDGKVGFRYNSFLFFLVSS